MALGLSSCRKASSTPDVAEGPAPTETLMPGDQPATSDGATTDGHTNVPTTDKPRVLALASQDNGAELRWSDLKEPGVTYELFVREGGGTFDFDAPLNAATSGGTIAVPPLPGRFCFVVRAMSPKWKQPRLSNEVCLNLGISGDDGSGDGDDAADDGGASDEADDGADEGSDDGGDDGAPVVPLHLNVTLTSAVALPGDTAALALTIDTNVSGTPGVLYSQIDGPAVTLVPDGNTVRFVAPNVLNDSFVTVRASVTAGALSKQVDAKVKVIASMAFLSADATTGSDWQAANYGATGYWIPHGNASGAPSGANYPTPGAPGNDDAYSFPAGVSLAWTSGVSHYTWLNPSSAAAKAMFKPGMSSGIESCLYHGSAFEVDVVQDPAERRPRVMRVYVTDHENSREQDIIIKDKDSGAELHRFEARANTPGWRGATVKGFWLSYRIFGDVTIRIEKVTGPNAILQGIVFDAYEPENHAPVAADRSFSRGDATIALGVTASDADGDALQYVWTQTAGAAVTLDDANAAAPSFAPPSLGVYTFNVRVSDWSGAHDDATVTVTATTPVEETEFLGADATTGPYWQAAGYGTAGYYIPAAVDGASANTGSYPELGNAGNYDLASLPDGVAVTWDGSVHSWIWANPGSSTSRSIERPGHATTIESCLWHESLLRVNVSLGNAASRILRLYVTDHENNRELDISVKSADGATTYATFEARATDANWRGGGSKGYWLSYRVYEDVRIEVDALSANAILQGIVWD